MAGAVVEGQGFWLPAEFLTDQEENNVTETEFCFPNDFPYDVQTKAEEGIPNLWFLSTSPQSTLARLGRSAVGSGHGSPNGVPSPPSPPLGAKYDDVVGDLIYRAADQVARMKLSGGDGGWCPVPAKHKHLLGPPRSHAKFHADAGELSNRHGFPLCHRNQDFGMWYGGQGVYQNPGRSAFRETGQAPWTIERNLTHRSAIPVGGFGGGAGMTARRSCAGTGVFLPRKYGCNNEGNAYTPGRASKTDSNTLYPYRPTAAHVHAPSKNSAQSQLAPDLCSGRNIIPDYDSIMALRSAILLQKQQQQQQFLSTSTTSDGRLFVMRRDAYLH